MVACAAKTMPPDDKTMKTTPARSSTAILRWTLLCLVMLLHPQTTFGRQFQLVADNPVIEADENRSRIALSVRLEPGFNPEPVTVRFTAVGGTAREGIDYELPEPTVVLEPFVPWGLVFLNLISDGVEEPTRDLLIDATIEGSTNAPVRIEVRILDGDSQGRTGFISTRFSVNEASPRGYAEIALWRTQDVKRAEVVTCRIEGEDFGLSVLGGTNVLTARFEPGDSRAYLRIPLVNDSLPQGDRDLRLSIVAADTTLPLIGELAEAVLTIADDDTKRAEESLVIRDWVNDGIRGVMITTRVPRGFQQRFEYSDKGLQGPWEILTVSLGQDGEAFAFDQYEESFGMRMYRSVPPEPMELTLPW
jgi:Calx-beta domain